jgi:hypothetical protein
MKYRILVILLAATFSTTAQTTNTPTKEKPNKDLTFNLNEDGSNYIDVNLVTQIWFRYNQSNPGTTVFGYEKNETFDIGLRRVRAVISGQLSDRVYFFTQFGINNFTAVSARKSPLFFHDASADIAVTKRSLSIGGGLTGWTGFARFSSPSISKIMGYDAPLFEQSTNDISDQFLRKLSIYAKGKLGKLDYRVIASTPMAIQNSNAVNAISTNSEFSLQPAQLQYSGYFMYQFFDEESNKNPYTVGTYLGKKKVFNIGAGFQYQADAMWRHKDALSQDTINEDMLHFAADIFYDRPIGKKGAAISFYATYVNFNFGKGYLRNLGVMNPANGTLPTANNLNGAGNAFPMLGTGSVIQGQIGYLLPNTILREGKGQLMPYVMLMSANYDRLNQNMLVIDGGINWFLNEHNTKLSLNVQNRPVFRLTDQQVSERKNMVVLQLQVAI